MSHWVFGYGSLIWRTGFDFVHSEPARLDGYHRSLCVLSHKYRGTTDCLGLVFGLDEGGSCNGVAFEVADEHWQKTLVYLQERELITNVYREATVPVALPTSGRTVSALAYVVVRGHPQYSGPLSLEESLRYIRQGQGDAGSCVDYVKNTARHLAELGIPDAELERLVQAL